jgi:polyisoprenoid-binding protein YceI
MRQYLSSHALAFSLFLSVMTAGPAAFAALPPAGDYRVDAEKSKVTFNVTNFLITSVDGQFDSFSGTARWRDSLAASGLEGTVETKSINTGNESRDRHLRSADYFDVETFPTMTFRSEAVTGTEDALEVSGTLTIKGIAKTVTFTGKLADGELSLETKINRQDFTITSGGTIKNTVRIKLRLYFAAR